MQISDLARHLPDEVWSTFEPVLPPVTWCGNGRPPASNRECLHGLMYVLVTGIGWEYVPACFPCGRTIRSRLKTWLQRDCFRMTWRHLAERYERLQGINWDQILLDGAKHKAQKGGLRPARAR